MLALISKKLLPCCLSTLPPYVPQASEQTDVPRIEVLGIRELARPEEAALCVLLGLAGSASGSQCIGGWEVGVVSR